jgi:hypothetical protein
LDRRDCQEEVRDGLRRALAVTGELEAALKEDVFDVVEALQERGVGDGRGAGGIGEHHGARGGGIAVEPNLGVLFQPQAVARE